MSKRSGASIFLFAVQFLVRLFGGERGGGGVGCRGQGRESLEEDFASVGLGNFLRRDMLLGLLQLLAVEW